MNPQAFESDLIHLSAEAERAAQIKIRDAIAEAHKSSGVSSRAGFIYADAVYSAGEALVEAMIATYEAQGSRGKPKELSAMQKRMSENLDRFLSSASLFYKPTDPIYSSVVSIYKNEVAIAGERLRKNLELRTRSASPKDQISWLEDKSKQHPLLFWISERILVPATVSFMVALTAGQLTKPERQTDVKNVQTAVAAPGHTRP